MSSKSEKKQGKLIIISAPSGAGKTTLVHYLLEEIPDLEFSVSCTTRAPRENEREGKDYYFISVDEFQQRIEKDLFVEYEQVYDGLYYGTLKSEIDRIIDAGKNVIFDIDVQGGVNLKKQYPKALSIFISPPNVAALRERLSSRNTENEATLEMRVSKSEKEMAFQNQFDVVIVNDNLEEAQKEIKKVVEVYLVQ